jgi:uncharacterized oxidoreductase
VDDPADIQAFVKRIVVDFLELNVLVNMTGIMAPEDAKSGDTKVAESTITTNLLGPIRATVALLDHLTAQPSSTVFFVSSGLAYVPLALTPTYGATKAAIRSYAQSLRHQLRDTPVEVKELIPPYVQTELMGKEQAVDPNAMPLADCISESMDILEREPDGKEVGVERSNFFRRAAAENRYDETFGLINHIQPS